MLRRHCSNYTEALKCAFLFSSNWHFIKYQRMVIYNSSVLLNFSFSKMACMSKVKANQVTSVPLEDHFLSYQIRDLASRALAVLQLLQHHDHLTEEPPSPEWEGADHLSFTLL